LTNHPQHRRSSHLGPPHLEASDVLKVVLLYAIFSAIYILVSDRLVRALFTDPEAITIASIIKGWLFVLITSVLLYVFIYTLLKRGLAQLQLREQAYRNLAEHSPAIIYQADSGSNSKISYVSARISALGYTQDEWLADPDMWIRHIHPEDLSRVQATLAQAHLHQHAFHCEYRLRTRQGEWRHFRDEAHVVLDHLGQPQYLQGMMIDISDLVKTEQQLRIAATAFESQDGMFVTDANQIILKVNNAFTQITGYSAHEAVGQKPSLLKSGKQDALFYQSMWDSLAHHRHWFGEIWNRRKNGEIYPEWLSISAVLDEQQHVTHYVASFSDISQRKRAEETIHFLSYYDSLTGLPNRKMLIGQLNHLEVASLQHRQAFAILHLGIDDFKKLNDARGYEVGNLFLVETAKRIKSCVQSSDHVARCGGDEFIVLLEGLSHEPEVLTKQTLAVAGRIQYAISQGINLLGIEHHLTASIGVTIMQDSHTSIEELLKRADAAMHQAKQFGADKVNFFDPALQQALEDRVLLETMLRSAIPSQLQLFYQAQFNHAQQMTGVEALLRWQHPKRGMISPAQFIPLAEETGLIIPMGSWVIDATCQQLAAWAHDPRTRALSIAVNVSAKQMAQPDFVASVQRALDQSGAQASLLELEITESLLVGETDNIIDKMKALQTLGVRWSLDDFGTGYSSLSYLKKLPIHQLKIDQSFVHDVLADSNDAAIVRTIIALGQRLGFEVIAEGVETAEQQVFLEENGCANYQGYYFHQPMTIDALESHFKLKP